MPRVAHHVVARFPSQELAIERLARSSETFRAMCDEYADGIEALERWRDAARPWAEVSELRDSLTDLEEEILQALREGAAPGAERAGGRRP